MVDERMKAPVRTAQVSMALPDERRNELVKRDRVPLRPRRGRSTIHPARSAPGTPIMLMITCCWDKD